MSKIRSLQKVRKNRRLVHSILHKEHGKDFYNRQSLSLFLSYEGYRTTAKLPQWDDTSLTVTLYIQHLSGCVSISPLVIPVSPLPEQKNPASNAITILGYACLPSPPTPTSPPPPRPKHQQINEIFPQQQQRTIS